MRFRKPNVFIRQEAGKLGRLLTNAPVTGAEKVLIHYEGTRHLVGKSRLRQLQRQDPQLQEHAKQHVEGNFRRREEDNARYRRERGL